MLIPMELFEFIFSTIFYPERFFWDSLTVLE